MQLRYMNKKLVLLVLFVISIQSICWADEYILIMSKDDSVCQHMLRLYNTDLKKYGKVKYKAHKEFNWIKWDKKEITLRPPSAPEKCEVCNMDIDAKIAFFDINNDSKNEAIIYNKSMLYNNPMDVYDIFATDDLVIFDNIVDGKIYHEKTLSSINSNDGTPQNIYEISEAGLKKLPSRMRLFIDEKKARGDKDIYFVGGSQKINLMKFNGRFYIAFEGPMSLATGESYDKVGNYSIVSELQPDNTLNNQCLYLIKKDKSSNRRTK